MICKVVLYFWVSKATPTKTLQPRPHLMWRISSYVLFSWCMSDFFVSGCFFARKLYFKWKHIFWSDVNHRVTIVSCDCLGIDMIWPVSWTFCLELFEACCCSRASSLKPWNGILKNAAPGSAPAPPELPELPGLVGIQGLGVYARQSEVRSGRRRIRRDWRL